MKNFKIKLILLVSLVFFTACSSVQTTPKYEKKEKVTWRKMEGSVIVLPLEAGDIIIKEKTANPIGMFGHVAVMKDDRTVVDYPKFGNKSYTIPDALRRHVPAGDVPRVVSLHAGDAAG